MAIKYACKCGRKFSAEDRYAGRKTRCAHCGAEFEIPLRSALEAAPMRFESWDEAVKRAEAEARAQADSVAENADASQAVPPPLPAQAVPQLIRDPVRSKAKSKLLVLIPVGAISSVCLWLWFAGFSQGYNPKHRHPEMPDYAAKFLMVALRERDCLEDARDYAPLAKAQTALRELYEDGAATMPPGREYELLLSEAASYFDGDVFDVWFNCRSASEELYREGTKPTDILEGLVQTIRSASRRGLEKRVIRRFVVYDMLRREEHLRHKEAIADLTRRMRTYGDF
jgi:hypothetical protein